MWVVCRFSSSCHIKKYACVSDKASAESVIVLINTHVIVIQEA